LVPRFGFAFRPFANGKTVLRGGIGMFDTPSLGLIFRALLGSLQSNTQAYNNIAPSGGPTFQWPQTRTIDNGFIQPLGSAFFSAGDQIHWKEPYTMQWNLSIDRQLGFNTGLRLSYIGMGTRDLVSEANVNQSYYSKQYYQTQPLSNRPFPNWGPVILETIGANANYQSAQIEVSHHLHHGLAFNSSYTFAKSLANNQGPNPATQFASEGWQTTMDFYNRRAEYGEVSASRRHRWLTTAVYELPLGRGHTLFPRASRLANGLLGGWHLSHIFLIQSGPYETPYFNGGDPLGSGSGFLTAQHPDRVRPGSLSNGSANQWIDPTAFVCPGKPAWASGQACTIGFDPGGDLPPIGRFGNSGIGVVKGPGTISLSTGLGKTLVLGKKIRLKLEGSFTNILNHVNLNDPQLQIDAAGFGQITSARSSDFGGYRTGQVSVRIDF